MKLFFYGILQGPLAEGAVSDLLSGIGPGVPAAAQGRLYAVRDEAGAYPAMIVGDGEVRGMVHEAGSVDLPALDRFEGAQYRRAEIALADGQRADTYLWVEPVAGLEPIAHGDFGRWLNENGLRPYTL